MTAAAADATAPSESQTAEYLTPLAETLPASVPFVGPEAQERALGRPFRARLGANESVFGPSPKAVAAMQAAAAEAWMYGDPEALALRTALARQIGAPESAFVVGEGIDGLLGFAVRLLAGPGRTVVTSLGAYPTFNYHVAGYGARLVTVPYRDDHEDLGALLDAARRENAAAVYVSNPDNPMGSWHSAARLQELMDALPAGCVLLLDEAYIETGPPEAAPPLELDRPNVLRFRTFSKAHGLAGLRVGYVIGAPGLVEAFHKVRNHFGLGRVAQAGALGALEDAGWLGSVVANVAAARGRIGEIAAASDLRALPSAANFVAIDCGRDGAFAKAVLDALIAAGIFVRMPGPAPLNRCIRVTCGREADLARFAEALPSALDAAVRAAC